MNKRKACGFTMVELLITLVVAAILVGVAVPSFRDMIERNQVATTTNDLISAILLTRSEAVKREANMVIAKATDWKSGWTVTDPSDTVVLQYNSTHSDIVITAEGNNTTDSLTYTAQGRANPALVSGGDYFKVSMGDSETCINFSASGRPGSGDCP